LGELVIKRKKPKKTSKGTKNETENHFAKALISEEKEGDTKKEPLIPGIQENYQDGVEKKFDYQRPRYSITKRSRETLG